MSQPLIGLDSYRLGTGDARAFLRALPSKSVHSVVTSPPYYQLRDYSTDPQFWGGQTDCNHELDIDTGICILCSAWRGELGLEPDPDLFVAHLVDIFRDVHKILRDDGVAFINIGDTHVHSNRTVKLKGPDVPREGNMLGIPWRLGLALQKDGWILKQDVIWSKSGGNCPRCHYRMEKGSAMPQPVRRKFVSSHEYVLFLSKKPRHYFDYVGIQQNGANRRDVLFLTSKQFRSADGKQHYAVMSEDLAEVCVKAATPPRACKACGAPWERLVKGRKESKAARLKRIKKPSKKIAPRYDGGVLQQGIHIGSFPKETIGWQPTCSCGDDHIAGIVLDPFSGTGTTGAVALRHGRRFFGIDVDPDIRSVAETRLEAELAKKKTEKEVQWLTNESGQCVAQ